MAPKAGLIFPFPGEINRAKSMREKEREVKRERESKQKYAEAAAFGWKLFFFSCSSCLGRFFLSVTLTLSGVII